MSRPWRICAAMADMCRPCRDREMHVGSARWISRRDAPWWDDAATRTGCREGGGGQEGTAGPCMALRFYSTRQDGWARRQGQTAGPCLAGSSRVPPRAGAACPWQRAVLPTAGTQARRHAGTQARRHAGTQRPGMHRPSAILAIPKGRRARDEARPGRPRPPYLVLSAPPHNLILSRPH